MNEGKHRASDPAMDRLHNRFDERAMLAFDGELPEEERAHVRALPGADAALSALTALSEALRSAVTAPPIDVTDAVMEATLLLDDDAWAPLSGTLRDALTPPAPPGLADDIFAALEGGLPPEGEDEAWEETRALLRDALTPTEIDVWPSVAEQIGADPADVEGWAPIQAQLKAAFEGAPKIDVTDAVMAAVRPAAANNVRHFPVWIPVVVAMASAAGLLLVASWAFLTAGPNVVAPMTAAFTLHQDNDAQVEDLSTPEGSTASVIQFEDGGPTFIVVEEGAPSPTGEPQ